MGCTPVSAVAGKSSHACFRNTPEVPMETDALLQTDAPPDSPRRSPIHAGADVRRLLLPRGPCKPIDPADP